VVAMMRVRWKRLKNKRAATMMIFVGLTKAMKGGGGEGKRTVVKREEEEMCLRGRTQNTFVSCFFN